jgi:hypothetical protein
VTHFGTTTTTTTTGSGSTCSSAAAVGSWRDDENGSSSSYRKVDFYSDFVNLNSFCTTVSLRGSYSIVVRYYSCGYLSSTISYRPWYIGSFLFIMPTITSKLTTLSRDHGRIMPHRDRNKNTRNFIYVYSATYLPEPVHNRGCTFVSGNLTYCGVACYIRTTRTSKESIAAQVIETTSKACHLRSILLLIIIYYCCCCPCHFSKRTDSKNGRQHRERRRLRIFLPCAAAAFF